MKPTKLIKINQYHIDNNKTHYEYELIMRLINDGYKIDTSNIDTFILNSIGFCLDNEKEWIFSSNITCMASYCSYSGYKPLNGETFLKYYDDFIYKKDIVKFNYVSLEYTKSLKEKKETELNNIPFYRLSNNISYQDNEVIEYYLKFITSNKYIMSDDDYKSFYGYTLVKLNKRLIKKGYILKRINTLYQFYPIVIYEKNGKEEAYIVDINICHRYPYIDNNGVFKDGYTSPYTNEMFDFLMRFYSSRMKLYLSSLTIKIYDNSRKREYFKIDRVL